jgi:hypothetical protein
MNDLSSDTYLAHLLELSPENLASSLVHDLRNKVNGILAGASVIQIAVADANADTNEGTLKQIEQSAEYILEYTKDMMAILDAYLKYDDIQQEK